MPPSWTPPHPADRHPVPRDGRRNCGVIEQVLRRQWDPGEGLPPQDLIYAVDRIASLPVHLGSRLAEWLEGLWIGVGPVTGLDGLGFLRDQPVAEGSATVWSDVPGAVVGRTMAIGTGEHLSVSLVDHELGHCWDVMDDLASTPDWRAIMWRCRQLVIHPRYEDPHEMFAEAYAHVATGEFRRLTRLLSGSSECMELLWAYYRWELGLEVTPK